MYASIAGLKAHMQKLTVIGNNVANVNTTAYKKQRTVFRDSIYSMYSSGSNGSETVGGMNPSQLGYGSLVASIDLDMSTSSYNPGNPMDCAIVGDGFFLVGTKDQAANIDPRNPESFKSLLLTRTGDFRFSADGYLTDGMGNTVYGFLTTGLDEDGKPTVSDQLVPIRFPRMQKTIVDKKTGKPVDTTTATDIWADAEHTKLNEEKYAWSYEVKYPVDKATGDNNQGGGTTNTPSYVPIEDYNPLIHEKNDNQGGNTGNNQETDTTNPLAYAELESITIDKKTGCISGVTKDGGIKVVVGYLSLGVVTNPHQQELLPLRRRRRRPAGHHAGRRQQGAGHHPCQRQPEGLRRGQHPGRQHRNRHRHGRQAAPDGRGNQLRRRLLDDRLPGGPQRGPGHRNF